jgi:predicted nucleotidyltransferase
MNNPKRIIVDTLNQIEHEHHVRILWAIESGSRSWGFESPDSDYDVRFIYIHRPEWYLSVFENRDVIEIPVSKELDVSGWDLRKTLRLFKKSNPVLMEWLVSPLVYKRSGSLRKRMLGIAPRYFSRKACAYHYLHMAENNYKREIKKKQLVRLKKYFYVLRPLINILWLKEKDTLVPMSFTETLRQTTVPAAARKAIDRLLAQKKQTSELGRGPRIPAIDKFIDSCFEIAREYCIEAPEHSISTDAVNELFLAVLNETWEKP